MTETGYGSNAMHCRFLEREEAINHRGPMIASLKTGVWVAVEIPANRDHIGTVYRHGTMEPVDPRQIDGFFELPPLRRGG